MRVSHHHSPSPCRAAVRTCRAAVELEDPAFCFFRSYLTCTAIQQHGWCPAHCSLSSVVISAPPRVTALSGMDTGLRGFLHAKPGARLHKMAHTESRILRFRGDRERSPTRLITKKKVMAVTRYL